MVNLQKPIYTFFRTPSFWMESSRISEIETDILLQREPSSTLYPSGLEPIATALPLCMRCGREGLDL
jgi:hypothetical protein